MLDILRQRSRCHGSALFRGAVPHSLEQLDGLQSRGVTASAGRPSTEAHWTATLSHPDWGEVRVACLKTPPPQDRQLLSLDPKLTEADVTSILDCGVAIEARMHGKKGLVLRDRKYLLRFLDAILGADGLVAIDHTSQTYWTRPALADELAHDADLDVESIFCLHAVGEHSEDGVSDVSWLHSHGLGELGRFDFDILQPAPELMSDCQDLCRALAFAIVEGHAVQGMTDLEIGKPLPKLYLMPAEEFMSQAEPRHCALRDDSAANHTERRVVLCDRPRAGLLGRLLGRSKPQPARCFRRGLAENTIFHFSSDASELMAQRARQTFSVLREVREEIAELELPVLVKLGFQMDGESEGQKEHLWFEVNDLGESWVDATLVNSPIWVDDLEQGDRDKHSIESLSDWAVLTPFGQINPHALHARRLIRDRREEMIQILEEARRSADE